MRRIASIALVFASTAPALGFGVIGGATTIAEQGNAAHAHIRHVMDGWNDTPDGQDLLPAAIAEARIAAQHASFAAKNPSNLDAMKLHAAHVLHAVDPEQIAGGLGLGYGVKKAAAGASGAVMTHSSTWPPPRATPSRARTRSSRWPRRSRWPTRPRQHRSWSPNSTPSPSN